jgi:hypothetical protein
MTDEELIQLRKEWLARRKARLDQLEKKFQDQYPVVSPRTNEMRLNDLEAWKFEIEINEWELNNVDIPNLEDLDEAQD